MKLSGVAWLVPVNFWVGSTSAQSLLGRPWPAPRPFAKNLSPPWFLMHLGHVIPFWKGFDEANKMGRQEFRFGAQMQSCGC